MPLWPGRSGRQRPDLSIGGLVVTAIGVYGGLQETFQAVASRSRA